MPRLYLVRHGEPASLWGAHPDPGLSELGHEQARRVADMFPALGVGQVVTSPLARCRETSQPTCALLRCEALIEPAVAEIPVPPDILDHRAWLSDLMKGSWQDQHVDGALKRWRETIGQTLLQMSRDTVIFTHFVAINAAVGIGMGHDGVTIFKPGHASVTVLDSDNKKLHVHDLGHESAINLA
jgi:broad specificity phosphatase PhoE